MFIVDGRWETALRQEGHVYSKNARGPVPSVRRAMFIAKNAMVWRPPSGGPCL